MSVSVLPAWRPDGAFCGRDGERGGSWQGVSESGLMVAITNRLEGPLDPIVRSRGQLCLDALRQPTSADAIDWVLGYLQRQSYNLFNLICADARQVLVLHYAGQPDVRDLQPGSHVVADTDADDRRHPRIERAGELLAGIGSASWDEVMPPLARIMADHAGEGEGTGQLCHHGGVSGTVSSSLVAIGATGLEDARFHFAQGPPCTHAYLDLSKQMAVRP